MASLLYRTSLLGRALMKPLTRVALGIAVKVLKDSHAPQNAGLLPSSKTIRLVFYVDSQNQADAWFNDVHVDLGADDSINPRERRIAWVCQYLGMPPATFETSFPIDVLIVTSGSNRPAWITKLSNPERERLGFPGVHDLEEVRMYNRDKQNFIAKS